MNPPKNLLQCLAQLIQSDFEKPQDLELAQRILSQPGKGLSPAEEERAFFTLVESASIQVLNSIPEFTPCTQARLLAAIELGKRYTLFKYSLHKVDMKLTSLSQLTFKALEKVPIHERVAAKEWLGFVPIYRSGEIGDFCIVEYGVRTHVNIDPAELFARVLALRPCGFFLFHNHPSGKTLPSREDQKITRLVDQVSQKLGLQLLGHWIVTAQTEKLIPIQREMTD